jgi:guanosine-3',5'-bis(diphosphate) 3'-pyrophosphohydrolase
VAAIVEEVTDTKWLKKGTRERLQVSRAGRSSSAAKLVKLADKICNLRDILASPPADWSVERKREYFDWAKSVIDRFRGANARLEKRLISCMGCGRESTHETGRTMATQGNPPIAGDEEGWVTSVTAVGGA